jgi:hypothetical protein
LAFYPFLFPLYVVLNPLVRNIHQVDPVRAFRPLLVLWTAGAVGLFLLYFVVRDWQYASYLIFMAFFFFFVFGYVNRFTRDLLWVYGRMIDENIFLAVCAGLFGILLFKGVWRRLGGPRKLILYLNAATSIWLIFPFINLAVQAFPVSKKFDLPPDAEKKQLYEIQLDCTETPDIYYIILDAYGRADILQELYGFDNTPFLDTLREQGFYIADGSFTNYIQTIYSIPSSLSFKTIDPPGGGVSGRLYFSNLMRNANVMSVLEQCGYRTIAFESGYFFTERPKVDVYLRPGVGETQFEDVLLSGTPLEVLADELNLEPAGYSYEGHRRRVLYSFDQLENLYEVPGPKFVFAHILSPHPPFVFDEEGSPIEPGYSYNLGDGDDFLGSREDYISGYRSQVQYVNQRLVQAIQSILENTASPPIIILQGDHGPGSMLVWDSPEKTCLWERTPILNAYYLPESESSKLYPSISPVNTFRVILNAQFGTELPLLPDVTYFTSHHLERQMIDITSQRDSRDHCSPP